MITWERLKHCLTELVKLENGDGSEIEFFYNDKEYCLIHYASMVTLGTNEVNADGDEIWIEKEYATLEKLEKVSNFGFYIGEVWNNITGLVCKPDFEDEDLDVILEAYRKALGRKKYDNKK